MQPSILQHLDGVKKTGTAQWIAKCPAHDDRKASLSISVGNEGQTLVHCHANCALENVLVAIGLHAGDLFPDKAHRTRNIARRLVAAYPYCGRDGTLIYEKLRYEPKEFQFRRPDGNGGVIYNVKGVVRLLYHLPAVADAIERGDSVFLVEGEKDADAIVTLGLVATTNDAGGGKWCVEYTESLRGADVILCGDNDEPGRKHVQEVAEKLLGIAKRVRVLTLPGLPDKGDISDWIAAGGDRVQLETLVQAAPDFTQPKPASERWPDPEPLPDTSCAVDSFDADLLPVSLRGFVMDISERMQCPPDFPAVATIVTLGSLLGRQVAIRPKRQDDWTVIANLWGGVVGVPAIKKTPSMQPAMSLLARFESEAGKEFDAKFRDYNLALEAYELRLKAAKQNALKLAKSGDDEAIRAALDISKNCIPPTRRRYYTSDATVEKLGELLRDNRNGILLFRDELTGWLYSLARDGHQSDRAFFLEAWKGVGPPFSYDRIGRGTVIIESPCVSILGGIQPGPLIEYFRSALHDGAGADGLIQRFQLLVWPDVSREWRNVDRWPDTAARDKAFEVFARLNTIDLDAICAEHDKWGGIQFLRFSPDAQVEFFRWQEALNLRLRAGNQSDPIGAHLAKYESMVAALALLIHLADTPTGGPVSLKALERALGWARYLETHARRIYGSCARGELEAAHVLLRRIECGDLPHPFTSKNIYKNHWGAGLSRREDAEAALSVLEDHGWVRARKVETGGRPSFHYFTHPCLRKNGNG